VTELLGELQARYRQRFLAGARARLGRIRDLVAAGDPSAQKLGRELHTLVGDAGLLEHEKVAAAARASEEALARWRADGAERAAFEASLAAIERALAEMET
jgi:HPt (histidine-containing phosphotransfer) domain-containing protein